MRISWFTWARSAIHDQSMPVSAALRPNSQSAMRNMRTCFKRSELELREPTKGLKIVPRGSR
eukprot:2047461-Alexandrium_andersonii.AAC.1